VRFVTEVVAGRFELIDQIGVGGAGSVWRAYDRREGRYCAAKLVRERDSAMVIRVIREQGVRLSHPHVLSPYAWAADDDVVLVATELMHGGSLTTVIRDHGALPWRYAGEIVAQVLDGLAHVHAAGLVHRDIKPANVLLAATGRAAPHARVADFGIAYELDGPRLTELGVVIGTPGYLAPEVLAGRGPHPSQDLFSVGVLAWQLLAGQERPGERLGDDPPQGVPDSLWTVVRALLDHNPLARPRDAAAAGQLLRRVLAAQPLELPALSAVGEPVEVFDVLGPVPGGVPADAHSANETEDDTVVVPASARPSTTRRIERDKPRRRVTAGIAVAVLVVVAVAVGLVVILPEVGAERQTPDTTTPGQDATSSVTVPSRPPNASIRAGLPCDWQDVASVETGADGTALRCVAKPGGGYAWQPAA
jgi:serine/threonine protein kinase